MGCPNAFPELVFFIPFRSLPLQPLLCLVFTLLGRGMGDVGF